MAKLARRRITLDPNRAPPKKGRLQKGQHYYGGGKICVTCNRRRHYCPKCRLEGMHVGPWEQGVHCPYPIEMLCEDCGGAPLFGADIEWGEYDYWEQQWIPRRSKQRKHRGAGRPVPSGGGTAA